MEIKEIEHKIACHELSASQVFTQMLQHIHTANMAEHEADHDRQKAWDYTEELKCEIIELKHSIEWMKPLVEAKEKKLAQLESSSAPACYDANRIKKLVEWLEEQAEDAERNADIFEDNRQAYLLEEMNLRAAAEIIKAAS